MEDVDADSMSEVLLYSRTVHEKNVCFSTFLTKENHFYILGFSIVLHLCYAKLKC